MQPVPARLADAIDVGRSDTKWLIAAGRYRCATSNPAGPQPSRLVAFAGLAAAVTIARLHTLIKQARVFVWRKTASSIALFLGRTSCRRRPTQMGMGLCRACSWCANVGGSRQDVDEIILSLACVVVVWIDR